MFIMISKKECPFCIKAKDLLKNNNLNFEYLDVDTLDEGRKSRISEIAKRLNHSTYPMIAHDNKFIGGYDDLQKYLK